MLSNDIVEIDVVLNNNIPIVKEIKSKILFLRDYNSWKSPDGSVKNCTLSSLKISELKETLKFYRKKMQEHIAKICFKQRCTAKDKKLKMRYMKLFHDFGLTGNKTILMNRLQHYFNQENLAIVIQKYTRKFFVKKAFQIIGPALKDRTICVNDNDFYSFEKLENIPFYNFFSYEDKHNFIYGFELSSLIDYMRQKRNKRITNPYNRDEMDNEIPKIKQLYRLIHIINKKPIYKDKIMRIQNAPNAHILTERNIRSRTLSIGQQYDHTEMIEKIRTLRSKSPDERTRLLFLEIDQLGNYSDYRWFINLDRRSYLRYFRILKDIWTYRAQIPTQIKIKICPLWDPFIMLSTNDLLELNTQQLKCRCLSVMEDMVYTGVENEYRTLGAFHVLSVLTVINGNARQNMPWLYESLL